MNTHSSLRAHTTPLPPQANPALAQARSSALEYLTALRASCGRRIFDFRMPEKVEIKK